MTRHRTPLFLSGLALVLAGPALCWDVPLAEYKVGRPCTEIKGGHVPPRKPMKWADQRYLEVAPAMTLEHGNVLTIDMVPRDPADAPCNLGAFLFPGMQRESKFVVTEDPLYVVRIPEDKQYKVLPGATPLRAIFEYKDGSRVHLNRITPGLMLETKADSLPLFVKNDMLQCPYRVKPNVSTPPAFVAFSKRRRIEIMKAEGEIPLRDMDQPWLIAWWDGKAKFDIPLRPQGGGPHRNIWPIYPAGSNLLVKQGAGEWPMLIVLERRCRSIQASDDEWNFRFPGPAGRVIIAPLFGRRWLKADEIAKWRDGIPRDVVRHASEWAQRLRCIPTDVKESVAIVRGRPVTTEQFTYDIISDDWRTRPRYWAPLPPVIALAREMGLAVESAGRGRIEDWDWLHRLGPVAGVDNSTTISFTINSNFEECLQPETIKPDPRIDDPDYKQLRNQLRTEVGRIIEVNDHMAPHHWIFGEMHAPFDACYFYMPGELFTTLSWTLPFLEPEQAGKLRAYMRDEFKRFSPFIDHKWGALSQRGGVPRERYPAESQFHSWRQAVGFNLHNIYGAWAYAHNAAAKNELPDIIRQAKAYLQQLIDFEPFEWDYTMGVRTPAKWGGLYGLNWEVAGDSRHGSVNGRLNGMIGFIRLARMAGDREAEELGSGLLVRLMALRLAQICFDQFHIDKGVYEPQPFPAHMQDPARRIQSQQLLSGYRVMPEVFWTFVWKQNEPWSKWQVGDMVFYGYVREPVYMAGRIKVPLYFLGLDLTPEVGRFYHAYAKDYAELGMKYIQTVAPTWYNAQGIVNWGSEDSVTSPEVSWGIYMSRAFILGAPGPDLARYVDFPQAKFGDMYYLQKLTAALRAYCRTK